MKLTSLAALATLALCLPLAPGMALAEEAKAPIVCEYEPEPASVRCVVNDDRLSIDDITVNDGKCRIWDHRLLSASLGQELRESGQIGAGGDYTTAELDTISAAILGKLRDRRFHSGDFFRFESYRCTLKNIAIATPLGTYALRTQP